MMLVSLIQVRRWNEKDCGKNQKNVPKNFKLICLRTNNSFFSLLGTRKILSLGEFDESKNSLDF